MNKRIYKTEIVKVKDHINDKNVFVGFFKNFPDDTIIANTAFEAERMLVETIDTELTFKEDKDGYLENKINVTPDGNFWT